MIIHGGRTLIDGYFEENAVHIEDTAIVGLDSTAPLSTQRLDARGLLVMPGIVDLHGDAFERQIMPRPGVSFPIDVALAESDRQAIANGITTVFHSVTWSWEPGLRGSDNAKALVQAITTQRPQLAANTRFHLRHETFNSGAEATIIDWIGEGRIDLLAFNDHMDATVAELASVKKRARMVERSGLSDREFDALVESVVAGAHAVPQSMERLAAAARKAGIPMLSHDDRTPAQRHQFRNMGVRIAEFPINVETAQAAADHDDFIIMGAPNVVRGGSHTGWTRAADMVAQGLCSILASDYYYPAPLLAAFRLNHDGIMPLNKAWKLVSETPAAAAGLNDRGRIAPGQRADLVLVDASAPLRPRVVGVVSGGRLVYLTETARLTRQSPACFAAAE
jgi:alpha-D-ribose 1-methylphosphonate 5-triphosphate diphosphatase